MNKNNEKEACMWIGILLAAVAAGLLFLILWHPKTVSAPEKSQENSHLIKNTDNSPIALAIKQAANQSGMHFNMFSKLRVKGWTKHSADIDYLLVSAQGIILFRTKLSPAKSVNANKKGWFFETDNGEEKIKNPINMNKYGINVLRSLLKKHCKDIYDKINFTSAIVFNDKTEISTQKSDKEWAIIIKQNKIPDLIEMIARNPAVLSEDDINCINNAIVSAKVNG